MGCRTVYIFFLSSLLLRFAAGYPHHLSPPFFSLFIQRLGVFQDWQDPWTCLKSLSVLSPLFCAAPTLSSQPLYCCVFNPTEERALVSNLTPTLYCISIISRLEFNLILPSYSASLCLAPASTDSPVVGWSSFGSSWFWEEPITPAYFWVSLHCFMSILDA